MPVERQTAPPFSWRLAVHRPVTRTAPVHPRSLLLAPLGRHRDLGPLALRLFAGTFLVYMSQDNVFDPARMAEFEKFLTQFGFPFPALAAPLSVYAQFTAGVLFLLGLFVRPAAAVMIVNFIVALVMV